MVFCSYVYRPFYFVLLQFTTAKVDLVKQLQEQLDQAEARIRMLEAGLENGDHSVPSNTHQSKQSLPEVRIT